MTEHVPAKKIIAVDFDNTLNYYEKWGDGTIIDNPIEGGIEALKMINEFGWRIVIFTCRVNPAINGDDVPRQYSMLRKWLDKYGLSFVEIAMEGKPTAEIYVDDRGIKFEDNWNRIVSIVEAKSP